MGTTSSQAREAALARWSRLTADGRAQASRPARRAFLEKFEEEPNPQAALRRAMVALGVEVAGERWRVAVVRPNGCTCRSCFTGPNRKFHAGARLDSPR